MKSLFKSIGRNPIVTDGMTGKITTVSDFLVRCVADDDRFPALCLRHRKHADETAAGVDFQKLAPLHTESPHCSYYALSRDGIDAWNPRADRWYDLLSAVAVSLRSTDYEAIHVVALPRFHAYKTPVYGGMLIRGWFNDKDLVPEGTVQAWWRKAVDAIPVAAPVAWRGSDDPLV